ncbi:MAG: hypothetical protein AUI36_26545 [Cyanobacteria bacterium 13_1_40CM_2_61_4]|nr:MAG: hypothetical protein AUI36_26545 [Cyanobacteria bacterium 13_1_40CM_2_61_4]
MQSRPAVWTPGPKAPDLQNGEVHVWRVSLHGTSAELGALLPSLTAEERAKAERFCFDRDRVRFVAAHAALHGILARYLNTRPEMVTFAAGPGKPTLAIALGGGRVKFNLSHSRDLALVAVSGNREVGVDVEWIRSDFPFEGVAERFFPVPWLAFLQGVPPGLRRNAFYALWARVEACAKAHGHGLPGLEEGAETGRAFAERAVSWTRLDLPVGLGYAAAVATPGCDIQLELWQWIWEAE